MAFLFRRSQGVAHDNYDFSDIPTRITIESPAKVIAATYAHKLDNALLGPDNIVYERTLFTSPSSLELLPPQKEEVDRLPTIHQSDQYEEDSDEEDGMYTYPAPVVTSFPAFAILFIFPSPFPFVSYIPYNSHA